ncbi:uncharacterized protein LOC135845304 isoform X2 [Planococcus citri]|uniref:uncharacterized protein LOC135845304 isoform X2 n=1 Tax=Planococcus citri TaxID=170843 RepID=UPI0031F7EA4E
MLGVEDIDISSSILHEFKDLIPDDTIREKVVLKFKEERKKKKELEERLFPYLFFCAVNTVQGDIDKMLNSYKMFDPSPYLTKEDNELSSRIPPFPWLLRYRMGYHDGCISTIDLRISEYRNFVSRLMFDEGKFFESLRQAIKSEYGETSLKFFYGNFAATIVRDYSLLSMDDYKSSFILHKMKDYPSENFHKQLTLSYRNWFMNDTHIKHINMLRKAHFGEDIPEIFGFPFTNREDEQVVLPLYDECGREEGFTLPTMRT